MRPLLSVGLILIASCNKPDVQVSPPNSWAYSAARQTADTSSGGTASGLSQIVFFAPGSVPAPSIAFYFLNRPVKDGAYKVVGSPRANDEMSIILSTGTGKYYNSTGKDGTTALITFKGSKISLYCSKTEIKQDLFVGGDSTSLSFSLTEF